MKIKGRKWSPSQRQSYESTIQKRDQKHLAKLKKNNEVKVTNIEVFVPKDYTEEILDFLWNQLSVEMKVRLVHNEIASTTGI